MSTAFMNSYIVATCTCVTAINCSPVQYTVQYVHMHNYWTDMYMYMIEPQVPWLRTAIYHTGLDVKMEVTQCTGHVSANTRHHQLHWGDREWAYYMCTSITLSVLYSIPTSSSLRSFLTYRISLMTVMNPSSVAN